jgi:signal transduction histidine kinase
MRPAWWRYALSQRLGTLAAAALIFWTVVTSIAAAVATDRIADAIRAERLIRARAIAARIDAALEDELRQLDLVAATSARSPDPAVLAESLRHLRLAESVLRLDAHGRVLWARSVADGGETRAVIEELSDFSTGSRHVEGTNLLATPGGARAFLMLPARESDPIGGALAAAINPETSALRTLVASYAEEPYRIEVLDGVGREIVGSRRSDPAATTGTSLEASVPVSHGPWHVRLSQPRDAALAPVLTLRWILVGSSLLLLPFAVIVAVAAGRSIRQPVLAMTTVAERLARGEVTAPIAPVGEDEIGRLAGALEQLRIVLEGEERRTLLLKRVMSAQEEERRRIARELHDETTQQLSALAMQLDSLGASQRDAPPALIHAQAIAHSAIDNLHRVIHDLRPSMLDDLGLLPAIGSYADTHLRAVGVAVHCEFPDTLPPLSRDATTALYRVVQEALTNVARHAHAETVLIGCTVSNAAIVIEIEDDGIGFDPAAIAHPRDTGEGLGLLGMHERLALLGGRLDVESEAGHGTHVVAVLPLGAPRAGDP